MISPNTTFRYTFSVAVDGGSCFGQGTGRAYSFGGIGLLGFNPRFELNAGWLTLFPTEKPAQKFPNHWFLSGRETESPDEELRNTLTLQSGAVHVPGTTPIAWDRSKAFTAHVPPPWRELKSWALFVGDALESALSPGDALEVWRDGNRDVSYRAQRSQETILAAGAPNWEDDRGTCAVWQESDRHPNPFENQPTSKPVHSHKRSPAEWIRVHKTFVTARLKEEVFHLDDGNEASIAPYYVFLARSNKAVPVIAFKFFPRAVYSVGRSDLIEKGMIKDAAVRLIAPQTRWL
jgi:hypothetical protein